MSASPNRVMLLATQRFERQRKALRSYSVSFRLQGSSDLTGLSTSDFEFTRPKTKACSCAKGEKWHGSAKAQPASVSFFIVVFTFQWEEELMKIVYYSNRSGCPRPVEPLIATLCHAQGGQRPAFRMVLSGRSGRSPPP